jgi:signal transduction histidine kinase
LLANSAAVVIRAQTARAGVGFVPSGDYDSNVTGAWRKTAAGYAVEARLPLRLIEQTLGVGIIDSRAGGTAADFAAATWGDVAVPNALKRELPDLDRLLRPYEGGQRRVRILDGDGWVLADSGPLQPLADAADDRPSLIDRFFRYVLRRDDPAYATLTVPNELGRIGDPALLAALGGTAATAWYREGAEFSAIVAAAVPVDPDDPSRGAVVLEQASDSILTLTNKAMLRLVVTMVLLSLITTVGLLAYASVLSYRVGRLARAAETALGPRGEINAVLPGAKASDEIGDLSRRFQDLLRRLREYTEYLESLKSKLSHEIRTPLAIVQTSLDNLEQEAGAGSSQAYLQRLRQGTERLESILQAMTAATRVEQAITETRLERFDLAAVVAACAAAYSDVYPGQPFESTLPSAPVLVDGAGELIAQMLDKLIDNAVGFAAAGSAIWIGLEADRGEARLAVVNRGPLLPDAMRHQLFDSLVSVRESRGDQPHLGLGLYIVMLIAEFHRGQVSAENLDDGSGVRISVVLPRSDAGAA